MTDTTLTQTITWHTIDSVPKDKRVLFYVPGHDELVNERTKEMERVEPRVGEGLYQVYYSGDDPDFWWANDSCSCCYEAMSEKPTHWAELPHGPGWTAE